MLIETFVLLTLSKTVRTQGYGSCYYPGPPNAASYATGHYPCDPTAEQSLCCPTGWTCFSNKLCILTSPSSSGPDLPIGTSIRGTCTNPAWNDTICGGFCLNEPVQDNKGSLTACGNGAWCCSPDASSGLCDCASGKGTFSLASGRALTVIGASGDVPTSTGPVVIASATSRATQTSSITSMSRDSSTKAAVTTESSTSSNTIRPSSSSHGSLTTTTFSSSTPSTTTSSSHTSAATGEHSRVGTIVPAVVVPVLTLAIIGIAWWVFLPWYRRHRSAGSNQTDSDDDELGYEVDRIGPPAIYPPPIPHPYHSHTNRFNESANDPDGARRGLSQIRTDMGGVPIRDPYAVAATQADARASGIPRRKPVGSVSGMSEFSFAPEGSSRQ